MAAEVDTLTLKRRFSCWLFRQKSLKIIFSILNSKVQAPQMKNAKSFLANI